MTSRNETDGAGKVDARGDSPSRLRCVRSVSPRAEGWTLVELVITVTILSILTMAVIPLVKTSFKRQREKQLREALTEMRAAIDDFRRDVLGGPCAPPQQNPQNIYIDPRSRVMITDCKEFTVDNPDRYPPKLETLVEGINVAPRQPVGANPGGGVGQGVPTLSTKKKIYLRRIPVDPMTGEAEWDLRSSYDALDAGTWGGENVFDVRSKSKDMALNGEKYSDW